MRGRGWGETKGERHTTYRRRNCEGTGVGSIDGGTVRGRGWGETKGERHTTYRRRNCEGTGVGRDKWGV